MLGKLLKQKVMKVDCMWMVRLKGKEEGFDYNTDNYVHIWKKSSNYLMSIWRS